MSKHSLKRIAAVAALSFIVVTACGKKSADSAGLASGNGILQFVPADTPYLITSGKPLPDKVLDKLEPKADQVLKAYRVFMREVMQAALTKSKDGMGLGDVKDTTALIDELLSLFSIDGLRGAGIDRDSQFALFGNGLLPVFRIEVSDPDLFEKAISRIEAKADEAMPTAEIDGIDYRYIGDDEARLIVGVFDGSAVFTFMPSSFDDDQLRTLVGLKTPASNITKTDILQNIASEYGYNGHYIGFIDTIRIASTFLEAPSGLNAALFDGSDFDVSSVSTVCKEEVLEVAGIAPRVVFGYEKFDAKEQVGSLVVEIREDIASGLTKLSAPVPGLGIDPGGLVSFGMSIDIQALIAFYEARLDALEKDPYECEYFDDIQASAEKGRQALNQPVPPFVYGVRGFNAVVDDISDFEFGNGGRPESVDASLLIAMQDAQTMISMGAMFSPELAGLNLQPDGKAVELSMPLLSAVAESAFAAMLDDAVAISLGANAEKRVTSVLTAKSSEPPPAFSMTMDATRYYGLIAESMMQKSGNDDEELSKQSREAMRDAMLAIGEMYDRMAVDMQYTSRGVEVQSTVTLAD